MMLHTTSSAVWFRPTLFSSELGVSANERAPAKRSAGARRMGSRIASDSVRFGFVLRSGYCPPVVLPEVPEVPDVPEELPLVPVEPLVPPAGVSVVFVLVLTFVFEEPDVPGVLVEPEVPVEPERVFTSVLVRFVLELTSVLVVLRLMLAFVRFSLTFVLDVLRFTSVVDVRFVSLTRVVSRTSPRSSSTSISVSLSQPT